MLRLLLSRKGEVCSLEFRLLSVLFLNLVSALFRFWFRCFGCLFGRSCRGLFFFSYYRRVVLNLHALLVFSFFSYCPPSRVNFDRGRYFCFGTDISMVNFAGRVKGFLLSLSFL